MRIADENRPTVPLLKERAAKLGDVVIIDFIGRIEVKPLRVVQQKAIYLSLGQTASFLALRMAW